MFQEEFEKMMPSYIGTSIEEKPARLMIGENLHKANYFKTTGGKIPTIQQVIKCLDFWLNYHNSKPCSNVPNMTIKEVLNTVQKRRRAEAEEACVEQGSQCRLTRAPKQQ